MDESATKVGRDFYDVFHAAWDPPPGPAARSTIRIREQPSPGRGTRVVIVVDGEPLLQLRLTPRYEEVASLARRAAEYLRRQLAGRPDRGAPVAGGGSS